MSAAGLHPAAVRTAPCARAHRKGLARRLVFLAALSLPPVAGSLTLAPAQALARSRKPNAEAKRFDKRAKEAYKKRRWDDAIAAFELAHDADDLPRFLYNIGRCHEQKGELAAAVDYVQRYLDEETDEGERKEAVETLEILQVKLRKTMREIHVETRPSEARLVISSETITRKGMTPYTGWVPQGASRLSLSREGEGPPPGGEGEGEGEVPGGEGEGEGEVVPPGRAPRAGDLVITEFLANPEQAQDDEGEYFEVYVAASVPIELEGLVIQDEGANFLRIDEPRVVQPGDLVTFGVTRSGNREGHPVDIEFPFGAFTLANTADEIIIMSGGNVVDAVLYPLEWDANHPGVAAQLDPDRYDADANDSPAVWCHATAAAPGLEAWVDFGSPGLPNEQCGAPLRTCESLPDYAACDDQDATRHYDVCLSGGCQSPGCEQQACAPSYPPFPIPDLDRQLRRQGVEPEFSVSDATTNLLWQRPSEAGDRRPWNAAAPACERLRWGGFDDWRLPSIYELFSLVDPTQRRPAINEAVFRDTTPDRGVYWSSSRSPDGFRSMAVDFGLGAVTAADRNDPLYVRCVRGMPSGPHLARRFSPRRGEDQPVVIDHRNALEWVGVIRDQRLDASAWEAEGCSARHGGAVDWRLPTLRELMPIVDYRDPTQRLDPRFFPNLQGVLVEPVNYGFWTVTRSAEDRSRGWKVDLMTGETLDVARDLPGYGLCVRTVR